MLTSILGFLLTFALTVLQNASFTLVSRARNSQSIGYHAVTSVLSNGLWLIVIRRIVVNLDSITTQVGYLLGAVVGSVGMHIIAMRHIEKKTIKRRPRT